MYGLVDQQSFFNKIVAGENLAGYYLIKNGEFAYNKSSSADYPWGAIKRLDNHSEGVLSTLYICFSPKSSVCSNYLAQYFESNKWHSGISDIAQEGARNHGLLNVGVKDFFATKHHIPSSISEQEQIAKFLQLLDERIATQRRLIEDFISLRRAILQGAIKRGLSKKSWKFTTLNDILTERGERNSAGYDVCSVAVSEGVVNQIEYLGRSFAAKETGHYNVARYGDIIYTKSPTGSFPYGIVKRDTQKEPAAISPLYGVFVPKQDWIGILLGYYFESEINTFNYLHPIIQKGAKNTINITNSGFLANNVPLPIDESEALALAKCIETISHKIVLEKSVLAHYTEQRDYLLSKMFV